MPISILPAKEYEKRLDLISKLGKEQVKERDEFYKTFIQDDSRQKIEEEIIFNKKMMVKNGILLKTLQDLMKIKKGD